MPNLGPGPGLVPGLALDPGPIQGEALGQDLASFPLDGAKLDIQQILGSSLWLILMLDLKFAPSSELYSRLTAQSWKLRILCLEILLLFVLQPSKVRVK